MPTRKPNAVPWIGVVLLVLIGGDMGAYYSMIERFQRDENSFPFYSAPRSID